MSEKTDLVEFDAFLADWKKSGQEMAGMYEELYQAVQGLSNVDFTFMARPGVTYSLRPVHKNQSDRKFFAIMDVIDDEPQERWLSICFYEDMITDPEGRGDVVPGGLSGDDGYCFDMYNPDIKMIRYLKKRLQEGYEKASVE